VTAAIFWFGLIYFQNYVSLGCEAFCGLLEQDCMQSHVFPLGRQTASDLMTVFSVYIGWRKKNIPNIRMRYSAEWSK